MLSCVYTERRLAGGEEAQRRQAPGGTLAEKTLLTVTVVNAVIETAGMTVKSELHREIKMKVCRAVIYLPGILVGGITAVPLRHI